MRAPPLWLAAAVLVLGGCDAGWGSGREDPDVVVDPVEVQLDGNTFTSTSVEGRELVPGTQIALAFDHGAMAAQAGCNTMRGEYTDEGGTLAWTGPVASTRMACPPDLTAQDEWLAGLLADGLDIADGDADLTLESGEIRIELTSDDALP